MDYSLGRYLVTTVVPVPKLHCIPAGLHAPSYTIVLVAAVIGPNSFSTIVTDAAVADATPAVTDVVYVPLRVVAAGRPSEIFASVETKSVKVASLQATPKDVRAGEDRLTASETLAFTV